jgi:hypothetical protein
VQNTFLYEVLKEDVFIKQQAMLIQNFSRFSSKMAKQMTNSIITVWRETLCAGLSIFTQKGTASTQHSCKGKSANIGNKHSRAPENPKSPRIKSVVWSEKISYPWMQTAFWFQAIAISSPQPHLQEVQIGLQVEHEISETHQSRWSSSPLFCSAPSSPH